MEYRRWAFVKKLPSGFHVVSATSNGEFYEIAIHVRLLAACFASIPIQQGVAHDIETPTPDELQRDGLYAAKSRLARYQRRAICGIDFHGEGLGYYYEARHPTDPWTQWLVLYSDFRYGSSMF
ncbi:hypothetical protein QQZ08_009521 [Neonectria magnoliae]|uniref:Uncharacterized protein n=1 Tax=Neonectria magnoliae TaxID=2732573 RepID=A0ABR1HMU0_9HYPO